MASSFFTMPFFKSVGEVQISTVHGSDWLHVSNEGMKEAITLRGEDSVRDLHYALGELIRKIDLAEKS